MLFVFSCKNQTNKPNIPPDIPPQQNEIVITVSGDSNVKIAQSPSFNVLKNSTWADVKVKANQKVSFSDGFILESWRLANKYGKLLLDTEVFTENTTVFAVSQTDIPPQHEVIITVLGDSNVKVAQSPSFNVLKNSTWADVKVKANQKISFSDGFVLKSWHLTNKDGKLLLDTEVFTENTTVFAVSQTDIPQQDEVVITVLGDSNVKVTQSPSFNVLKNSTWASVKVKANQKITFTDGFVLKSWHLTNKDGKLLVDTEVFTENTTVFAVSEKESTPKPDPQPDPTAPDYKTDNGSTVNIEPEKDYEGKETGNTVIKGDIYIDDLTTPEFKEKLKKVTGNIYTDNLNINCFKPKTTTISGQSIQIKNVPDNFETKEITPEILKGVLELKKSKNFSTLKLNNKSSKGDIVEILFTIKNPEKNEYFDISDLAIFSFNDEFKLNNNSNVFLKADRTEKELDEIYNITPYAKITELLKLLENKALQDYITVGDVYVSGKVDKLLPYLAGSEEKQIKKIKEKDSGIKFLNANEFTCDSIKDAGINFTEYEGKNGEELSAEEFLEFNRRTNTYIDEDNIKGKPLYVNKLIVKDLDTKKISAEELESLTLFMTKVIDSITFKGGDLSKMTIRSLLASGATLKFEGATLPYNMNGSYIKNLILNNVTFPKQEIMEYVKKGPTGIRGLAGIVPRETNLEIYGYVKDSPLKDLTPEQLESLTPVFNMPSSYKGPKDIYDRLKTYIYKGESTKKEFGNFPVTSLNKKPQSPILLALLQGKADHTRG